MKALIKTLTLTAFLLVSTTLLRAQSPPHPNNGVAPTTGVGGNKPVGGGAPVGSGTLLLIGLAGLYGGKKFISSWKSLED